MKLDELNSDQEIRLYACVCADDGSGNDVEGLKKEIQKQVSTV